MQGTLKTSSKMDKATHTTNLSSFNGFAFNCYIIPDTDSADQALTPDGVNNMEKSSIRMLDSSK